MNLGNKIEELRKRNNLSRKQLADKLNLSEVMIQYIEKGSRQCVSDWFLKLPDIFNCSFAELFGEATNSTNIKLFKFPFYENINYNNFSDFNSIQEFKDIYLQEMIVKSLDIKVNDKIVILQYKNNNMEGCLSNNDYVIVRLNDIQIINDALYLVKEDKTLRIKKISKKTPFDTNIIVSSNIKNKGDYEPYTVEINRALNELIIGEVIFWGRSRQLSLLGSLE